MIKVNLLSDVKADMMRSRRHSILQFLCWVTHQNGALIRPIGCT
jgi:hypothetical protein